MSIYDLWVLKECQTGYQIVENSKIQIKHIFRLKWCIVATNREVESLSPPGNFFLVEILDFSFYEVQNCKNRNKGKANVTAWKDFQQIFLN